MFHYVTGVPFDLASNSGVYDNLTLWEQIDSGAQYTPAKKWLTTLPIVLCALLVPSVQGIALIPRVSTDFSFQPITQDSTLIPPSSPSTSSPSSPSDSHQNCRISTVYASSSSTQESAPVCTFPLCNPVCHCADPSLHLRRAEYCTADAVYRIRSLSQSVIFLLRNLTRISIL